MGELLTGLWTGMEIIATALYWKVFFQPRVSRRQYILAMAVMWCFYMVYFNTEHSEKWQIAVTLSVFSATSLWVNRGKLYAHILIALLCYCAGVATTNVFCYGVSTLLGISVEALIWRKPLFTAVVTSGKLATILLAWYIGHLWKERKLPALRGKWLLFTMLFLGLSGAMLFIASNKFRNAAGSSTEVAVFSLVLVAANVVFFYLADSLARSTEKLKETALLNQQLEIQTEQILALEKSYQAQRKTTHDFRNQLQTILELISMGKPQEAERYARNLLGQQTVRIFAVNSGHPVIDAVLNLKYQQAREMGIDMQIQVNDLSQVSLPTDMLVVLLSNLLDNAIEGCCRVEGEKMIFCKLIAEETLFLSVRNSSLPVTIRNGQIPTSKGNRKEHGYGLGRIRFILDKLGGEYDFSWQDGWFTYAAEIPL